MNQSQILGLAVVVALGIISVVLRWARTRRVYLGSLEEFCNLLLEDPLDSVKVVVTPQMESSRGAMTASVGVIGTFTYTVEAVCRRPGKRTLVVVLNAGRRFGSDYGFADSDERQAIAIKSLLLSQQVIMEIQDRLPGGATISFGGDRNMGPSDWTRLHADAKKLGVEV